jgi:ComF family protein
MGELLADTIEKLPNAVPQLIIPMPLHPLRLKERGFNQALELARPIAKRLGIPINNKSCERIRVTQAQSLIPAPQRLHNVENAFRVNENFQATNIAIIDDVITTGHTVNELSKVLRKREVEKITIWCCAKSIYSNF